MSIENGMRPEGAENFKAPEDKPKEKKGIFQKIRSSKLARTLGLGAALGGGTMMMQEKAQAVDWQSATRTASDVYRDTVRHKQEMERIKNDRERERLRHEQEMEREATRRAQDKLRNDEQLQREKTRRQAEALRNAERTGATKVKTATVGEETSVEITPGNTPEERMQAEGNSHEKEMQELKHKQRMEFIKNNPNLRGTIEKK